MEPGEGSQPTEQGRKRPPRRVWTIDEENQLLNILEEMVVQGRRCDAGSFRQGTMREMEKLLEEKIPRCGLKATPHIESKLKKLKKDYSIVTDMLSCTGFGWNDTLKCIDVDSENTWQTYLQKNPDANGWRSKPFLIYDRLCTIFGKDRATGAAVETGREAVLEMDRDNMEEMLLEDINESIGATTSFVDQTSTGKNNPPTSRRKRPRQSDGILVGLQEIATSFSTLVEKTSSRMETIAQQVGNKNGKIQEVVAELKKMNLTIPERCEVAAKICGTQSNLTLFESLDDTEREEFVRYLLDG